MVCRDDGVGMSKEIIEKYLLIAGASKRHDLLELERRCQARGFSVGRTARFGIGVLSYFLIADRMRLETCRSIEAGDADGAGWRFENAGIGSFGELRRLPGLKTPGTELRLHLRKNFAADLPVWQARLTGYLEHMLRFVPCRFRFVCLGEEKSSIGPGWAERRADSPYDSGSLPAWTPKPVPGRAAGQREPQPGEFRQTTPGRKEWQQRDEFRRQMNSAVKWAVDEGSLPDGAGRYRIRLPYFELPGGRSLALMNMAERRAAGPEVKARSSWCGMGLETGGFAAEWLWTTDVEIDWRSQQAGQVSVDRRRFAPNELGESALATVRRRRAELARDFATRNSSSIYATLNAHIARTPLAPASPLYWMSRAAGAAPEWAPILFPAADMSPASCQWRGRTVSALDEISLSGFGGMPGSGLRWDPAFIPADRVVVVPAGGKEMPRIAVPLWTGSGGSDPVPLGPTAQFPPEWNNVAGAARVWNPDHRLAQLASAKGLEWCRGVRLSDLPREDMTGDPGRQAAWMALMLDHWEKEYWEWLVEHDPEFLSELWKAVMGRAEFVLYLGGGAVRLTPTSWTQVRYEDDPLSLLPEPGEDFRLVRV